MNKTIITGIAALFCSAAFAQQVGPQEAYPGQTVPTAGSSEAYSGSLSFLSDLDAQAASPNQADAATDEYLRSKGLHVGANETPQGKIYIATGFAAFTTKPDNPKFEVDRSLTFQAAMADAKRSIAAEFGQTVERSMQSILEQPSAAESIIANAEKNEGMDPGILERLTDLAKTELNKATGTENSAPSPAEVKAVLSSSRVQDSIKRTAAHQVGGLVALKVFEKDLGISVVAYYSDSTIDLASVINGRTVVPKAPTRMGMPIAQWIKDLPLAKLYLSQGVQLKADENGNMVVISYGIATAASKGGNSMKLAQSAAETKAIGNIRSFAGELIVTSNSTTDVRTAIEYGSESTESISEIESSINEEIKATASKLKIPGIVSMRKWSLTDPRSNTLVFGVVCMWSVQSATNALQQGGKMEDGTTPGDGFKKPKGGTTPVPTPPSVNPNHDGESPESEMFFS